jgi:RHH-type proline utilization regulon transcriptional repressor/proline dehydrogenase/delta 1-pyrroline-5-carboxylate dehydrogenase
VRWPADRLDQALEEIAATGYGLTSGIHSRIDETVRYILARLHVGNTYVNRNMIGAVVGVQPFGGEGKSGTGPKAGGPLYLRRLQRDASASLGAHTIHEKQAGNGAFDALLAWAKTHGHERVAVLGEQYIHTTPLGTTLVLPGPTGERNTLSFAPRGAVLCAADSVDALLNQLTAVLATGNTASVAASASALVPAGLPKEVRKLIRIADDLAQVDDIAIALVETSQAASLLPQLAAREGALVAIVEMTKNSTIPTWRLVAERALCINTTAAGGNASLMTLEG